VAVVILAGVGMLPCRPDTRKPLRASVPRRLCTKKETPGEAPGVEVGGPSVKEWHFRVAVEFSQRGHSLAPQARRAGNVCAERNIREPLATKPDTL